MQHKPIHATAIPALLCDFYKVSHRLQYPVGSQFIYSTLTPRSNKLAPHLDRVVPFGFQAFIQKYLINYFNDNFFSRDEQEVVQEYCNFIARTMGLDDKCEHIAQLHQLGYLPLRLATMPTTCHFNLTIFQCVE